MPRCGLFVPQVGTFSGDDFNVLDFHGNRAFRIDSRALSLAGKRTLHDAHGNVVASMKKKVSGARA